MSAAEQRVVCANEDHVRPTTAVARLSWPDGRFGPTTACVGDMQWQVWDSLNEGRPVLVEPASGETAATKAMKEVALRHRRAYSEPVKAILLEAPDHPHYEELPETLEEREKLPARFHTPVWVGDSQPTAWLCAVCWDEGTATRWPCKAASEHGGEVFAR
jgi:hypothetical protein